MPDLSVSISEVGVITRSFNLIGWLCFIWHQTQETATEGQRWTLLILRPLLHNQESAHLLTILWTSVLTSFFGWSGLCRGDKLNQSELGGLLSVGTSSPNNGSSSRSLHEGQIRFFVSFWSVINTFQYCQCAVSILLISYPPLLYSSTSFLNIPQNLQNNQVSPSSLAKLGKLMSFCIKNQLYQLESIYGLTMSHMLSSCENLFTCDKECSECEKPAMYWQHKSKSLPVVYLKITQSISTLTARKDDLAGRSEVSCGSLHGVMKLPILQSLTLLLGFVFQVIPLFQTA